MDEIAIAVQFESLTELNVLRVVELRELFKDKFPGKFQEQPPLMANFETFGTRVTQPMMLEFGPNISKRFWFSSDDGHDLLQIQADRFVQNWRKVEGVGEYPRFDTIFDNFCNSFETFKAFLVENSLGRLAVNQCELSYFNNMEFREGETYVDAMERIFGMGLANLARLKMNVGKLEPEGGSVGLGFLFGEESPSARLYVQAQAAFLKSTSAPVIRLTLIFRGPVTSHELPSVRKFFLTGREAIVRAFDAMLTQETHTEFGRVSS